MPRSLDVAAHTVAPELLVVGRRPRTDESDVAVRPAGSATAILGCARSTDLRACLRLGHDRYLDVRERCGPRRLMEPTAPSRAVPDGARRPDRQPGLEHHVELVEALYAQRVRGPGRCTKRVPAWVCVATQSPSAWPLSPAMLDADGAGATKQRTGNLGLKSAGLLNSLQDVASLLGDARHHLGSDPLGV